MNEVVELKFSTPKRLLTILVILLLSVAFFLVTASQQSCDLPGDYSPCGEVTLAEVIDFILLWVDDQAELGDVITLIDVWANPTTTTTIPANITTLCDGSAEKEVNGIELVCTTEGVNFNRPYEGDECCNGLARIPFVGLSTDGTSCIPVGCYCHICTTCGNGVCEEDKMESWCNCLTDCPMPNGTGFSCAGEGEAEAYWGMCCSGLVWIESCNETTGECSITDGYCTKCGDGECVSPENKFSCPSDCYGASLCIPRDVNVTSASIDVTATETLEYPNLDLGNDGDAEWSYTGEFNATATIGNLSQEINEHLNNCEEYTCEIPLRFHSTAVAELRISNIAIWYQTTTSTSTTTTTTLPSINLTIVGNRPDDTMTITATDELSGEPLSDVEFRILLEGTELLEELGTNGILLFTPSESGTYTIVAHMAGYNAAVVEWEVTYNLLPELQCKTNVNGTLSTNTTWSLEGSPYCISEYITIEDGSTLTIEPGTEIAFNDSTMYVNGTLIAIGNESDKVLFDVYVKKSQSLLLFVGPYTSVLDNFIMQDLDLTSAEEDSGKINLTNGRLKNSDILIRHSYIYNNEFENCNVAIYEAYWKETMKTINVLNNTFHSETTYLELKANDAPLNFINNSIYGYNGEEVGRPEPCVIVIGSSWLLDFSYNSAYNNSGTYVVCMSQTYDSSITHNLIYDNAGVGIITSTDPLIEFNTITNNDVGISINFIGNPNFRNNNIYNNSGYDVKTNDDDDGVSINLSNNYWGTTNSSLISERIYDYYDNMEFIELIYEPFLTEPVSEAPSVPTTSTSTTI